MIVAIDFDGTIVENRFPDVGNPVPLALESMREIIMGGNRIILWTMRSGPKLEEAVNYLYENGIPLFGINANTEQGSWTSSPKAHADKYVDDNAIGCPLIYPIDGKPYVDWIRTMNGIRKDEKWNQ